MTIRTAVECSNEISMVNEVSIREGIKMTVMNMNINLWSFDIKIDIKKSERKSILQPKNEHDNVSREKITQSYQFINDVLNLR